MKIKANIKYPPPKFQASDLSLEDACKLVDALTKELVVASRHINHCETVLEHCEEYFCDATSLEEGQLLVEIKEVLK